MQVLASYDRYISIGKIVCNFIPMVRTVGQKTEEKTQYQFLASHGGYISILKITLQVYPKGYGSQSITEWF